jgi:glutaconate CoA-transferase subunit B
MRHDPKKFVEKLDFLTTPGYLSGPGAREAAGLPRNTGPHRVITELAVLNFHPETKRMRVLSLHPGVTLAQVHAATGFKLEVAESPQETPAPSEEELCLLRNEVDPAGYVLRRGG